MKNPADRRKRLYPSVSAVATVITSSFSVKGIGTGDLLTQLTALRAPLTAGPFSFPQSLCYYCSLLLLSPFPLKLSPQGNFDPSESGMGVTPRNSVSVRSERLETLVQSRERVVPTQKLRWAWESQLEPARPPSSTPSSPCQPRVSPGLTGLPPRGRSEAEAAGGGGGSSSSSRSNSRSRSPGPQEAMAGSGPRQHTGFQLPSGVLEGAWGFSEAPCEEEQGWGSAREKRRSQRLQKTLDAGAPDKARIVPRRGRAECAERAEGALRREAGEERGIRPANASRGL